MKIASIISAINRYNGQLADERSSIPNIGSTQRIHHVLVHTGQHYDKMMSDAFFKDLNLPEPNIFLEVGSGSHAEQTAEIMRRFEPVLLKEKPNVMIVVGDVNSTLSCTIVASKITYDLKGSRPLIAHVEAGLNAKTKGREVFSMQ
jgi:UDP-N-acetylglucosamine 2-epimerase (non-hydrolysing)